MKVLENTIPMYGISGKIFDTHYGTLQFKCKCVSGVEYIIEDKGYYLPSLPCRLFSPQTYIKNVSLNYENMGNVFFMTIYDKEILKGVNGNRISIPYDPITSLPIMDVYTRNEEKKMVINIIVGSVTFESNKNISEMKKYSLNGIKNLDILVWQMLNG